MRGLEELTGEDHFLLFMKYLSVLPEEERLQLIEQIPSNGHQRNWIINFVEENLAKIWEVVTGKGSSL